MSSPSERRSPFLRLLDAFFQEDNIKWVLGLGVCILLGSSLRLVTLHWQEYTPVWKYLILLGYTVAVFGLGQFSYHRMALRKTGTVLMSLTVLLIPISFLALHWIQPQSETTAIIGLHQAGLLTLLGINLAWSAYAANHIFRHFLRATQPTFLVCYLILCLAGAIVPGLPTAWSPILALALWAVFAAGTVKVNRHVFWLAEEDRLPRIFGFFPILLLGSQFAVVFLMGIASHITPAWMGLLCTLVSLPVLLTADAVARVFEQRTGGLVRPIPWSISGPFALGVLLSVTGVILAMTCFPASSLVVPTAMIAAVAMGVIAQRTQKSAFAWGLVVCVMIAYQTSPVFFKDFVIQIRDQAAAAVRESRLPYAFYGLTYAPLIAVFSVVATVLQRRQNTLFAVPLRTTATWLSCLLLIAAFTHPSAVLPVALVLCPMFAFQGLLFQRKAYLIPAAASFLSAAYGAPTFAARVWEWNVTAEEALLVWVAASALLLLPGILIDRLAHRLDRSDQKSLGYIANNVCQLFSLTGTIVAAVVWLVRFGLPLDLETFGSGTIAAGLITVLLASHALRWLKTGIGELTLIFASCVIQLRLTHAGLSSIDSVEALCGILMTQWVVSYVLERFPSTRVARAFGPASYRISFCGLSALFGFFAMEWTAEHFLMLSGFSMTGLLMMAWGFDAARRTGNRFVATLVWGTFFGYVSGMLTRWMGPVDASSWWMLAWTVTGLVLVGIQHKLIPVTSEPVQNANDASVTVSASRQRLVNWFAPLSIMLPVLFEVISVGSLLSLGWPQRVAGVLALCGVLVARRHPMTVELSEAFMPVLNWQLLVACAAVFSGATGSVLSMTPGEMVNCGLPVAAFAAISVWCFESRLRSKMTDQNLIALHQSLLLCLTGILLAAAIPTNLREAGASILWAVTAWGAVVGAAFTCAVRTQNRNYVWLGEAALTGAIGYFFVAEVLCVTSFSASYILMSIGLILWTFGRWAESGKSLAILSQPLQKTGYWLPMSALPLAVIAQLNDAETVWAGANSLPLIAAATFYCWQGLKHRQLEIVTLSAVMLNVAFFFLWKDLDWTDPQLFMMPIGISILALTELMNREIPASYHDRLRFIGALVILVSPVFHIVTGSWLHILALMVASAALALLAIGLRVRVLLYTSTAFLLADLVALVARSSVDEPSVLWIVGVLLGASIIALGAVCENHRETVLARLRGLAAELEQWS